MFDEPLNNKTLYCIIIHQFNVSMFAITTPISTEDRSVLLGKQFYLNSHLLLSTHTFRNTRVNKTTRKKSMQVKEVQLTAKN